MAVKLNKPGFENAVKIIKNGLEVEHDTNNWEAVKATRDQMVKYLNTHTLEEYGEWFLGIKSEADAKDAAKYVYPFGDLSVLHKSALVTAEKQATQNNDAEIKTAVQKLLEMINKQPKNKSNKK